MAKYTINFSPVEMTGQAKVLVGRQPFDVDRLNELRDEFRETHVFRRDGIDNVIVDVPVVAGQKPIGNVQEEIDLARYPKIWPSLLSAALVRAFSGVRDILSDLPVSVVGSTLRGLIQHPELPEWIQKRTLLRFDTRTIYAGDKRTFGLVCEARLKNLIQGSCAELLALGVSPLGRYVQVEEPHYDPRLMKTRRLVGRVSEISGDNLVLEDHAEGFPTVPANLAFLEARREIFDDCVRRILTSDAASVLNKAEATAASFHSGPGRKGQIEEALKYLREKVSLEAVPGAKFVIGPMLSSGNKVFPITEMIPKPILVFDPSGTRKDEWNERGIKKNGPYDQRTFSPKQLKVAVICQAKHEGQVDGFIAKFLEGMPDVMTGKNRVARYGDGFLRRFALEKPSVTFFTAPSAKASDYIVASRAALTKATDEGFKWDLALVQVEEEFKSFDDETNPYYATKSVFLKRDVPVQSVRLETMAQADSQLIFSMNHMSLATYAKLGGTPWLLASQQTVAHELVIGLGSHTVANSRIGSQQRFVGITTVFSSDGSYLLSDRTAVVPYEEYATALYDTLKRSITTVRKQDNWRSTDKVRLVFHMFKPPKDTEAEAIKRTVDDLELENVTFAFVHIAPSHPYLIFDNTQKGIGFRDPKKGILGPERGLHLKLGDYESLVVFSGASELKQASDGTPRPCLLKLHRLSTFTDMTYLARQAFEFSGHSWRMLSPEPFPITIRYSDLIAERLAGLNAVPGWDAEAVRFGQIGRTLWFL
ncbi:argonaute/piwi family protein [Ochrobactrum quorumnocens]|uniref:argonaute/piwi family protein n=1 Tax=Ochrobactrum quorumnocens TaxID=271865 RepID=UPI003BA24EA4